MDCTIQHVHWDKQRNRIAFTDEEHSTWIARMVQNISGRK